MIFEFFQLLGIPVLGFQLHGIKFFGTDKVIYGFLYRHIRNSEILDKNTYQMESISLVAVLIVLQVTFS